MTINVYSIFILYPFYIYLLIAQSLFFALGSLYLRHRSDFVEGLAFHLLMNDQLEFLLQPTFHLVVDVHTDRI